MKETYFMAETFTLMQNDYLIKKNKRKKLKKSKFSEFFFRFWPLFGLKSGRQVVLLAGTN